MISLHPFLPFLIGAALIPFLNKPLRQAVQLVTPVFSYFFLRALLQTEGINETAIFLGYSFHLYRVDALSLLFVYVFLVFSWLANLYALHSDHKYVPIAANLYAGSSIGAVLAGDFLTLFLFWEIMAVTSAFLIWNKDRAASRPALLRYFLVHLTGGLFFFSGLVLKFLSGENLELTRLWFDLPGKLMFFGFLVNAAIPPLHAWLADAYPEGTPEGSIYLSCFTTKVAVYVFARCFPGEIWLVFLGATAAVYGVVYALMENDIRRLLSYHIICQIGYMLCGIGIGGEIGLNGGVGHAVGNILFKGLLFMAAGAMIHLTGFSKLSDLGGLAKKNRGLLVFYMIGALAISGLPGLNGYVTKSLLLKEAHLAHMDWLAFTLLLVAVGTFLSITCKLAWFAFWGPRHCEENSQTTTKDGSVLGFSEADGARNDLPWNMNAAMAGLSILCFVFGLFPETLYRFLPYPVHEHVYSLDHVLESFALLGGTLLGFLLIRKTLHTKAVLTLDLDWFYRKGAGLFVKGLCVPVRQTQEFIQQGWTERIKQTDHTLKKLFPKQDISPAGNSLLLMSGATLVIGLALLFLLRS